MREKLYNWVVKRSAKEDAEKHTRRVLFGGMRCGRDRKTRRVEWGLYVLCSRLPPCCCCKVCFQWKECTSVPTCAR